MQNKATTKHTGNNIFDSTGTKYFNLEISERFMCSAFDFAHELFRNLSIEIFRFPGIVQECIFSRLMKCHSPKGRIHCAKHAPNGPIKTLWVGVGAWPWENVFKENLAALPEQKLVNSACRKCPKVEVLVMRTLLKRMRGGLRLVFEDSADALILAALCCKECFSALSRQISFISMPSPV